MTRLGGSLSEIARSLATVTSSDPDELRERALVALLATKLGAAAVYYRTARVDDEVQVTGVQIVGDPVMAAVRGPLGSAGALVAEVRDDGQPPPKELKAFHSRLSAANRPRAEGSKLHTEVLFPHDIGDTCRLLVYDGDELAGFVGICRPPSERLFRARERDTLRALVRPLQRVIVAAYRLERAQTPSLPGDLVVTPLGRVLLASAAGRAWLDVPGFAAQLQAVVRALDRGACVDDTPIVAGAGVELLRLDGGEGKVRYLVQVRPLDPVRVGFHPRLTARERAVAERLVRGDSEADIARELDVARETVKTHRRRIYAKLHVRRRAELVRTWLEHRKEGA